MMGLPLVQQEKKKGRTDRRWVWPKNTKMYYTASLAATLSMNGGAEVDRSGGAIKKMIEDTEREREWERGRKDPHMVCGVLRIFFFFVFLVRTAKVWKWKKEMCQVKYLVQIRASQMLAEFKKKQKKKKKRKRRAKFVPVRQWCWG